MGGAGASAIDQGGAWDKPIERLIRLRHDTAMPLYRQLEQQLSALITNGRLPRGAALPAERQLAEALGLSRATVQQSYGALRKQGLIAGSGRHGSIVQRAPAPLAPDMNRLRGFTQQMRQFGRQPSTRVLERAIVTDPVIAGHFGLPESAQFLHLIRIRYGDDLPMSRESAWYSIDAAPCLPDLDPNGSIYGQLADNDRPLSYCDQTIEAILPDAAACAIFGFEDPVPCLLIKRSSYLQSGGMVEYVEGLFRGDAFSYKLRVDV